MWRRRGRREEPLVDGRHAGVGRCVAGRSLWVAVMSLCCRGQREESRWSMEGTLVLVDASPEDPYGEFYATVDLDLLVVAMVALVTDDEEKDDDFDVQALHRISKQGLVTDVDSAYAAVFPYLALEIGVPDLKISCDLPYKGEENEGSALKDFLNHALSKIGGKTNGPGDVNTRVSICDEYRFAMVDMRSVEETSNTLALDGVEFEGKRLKISRSSLYHLPLVADLGPSQPSPNLNLSAVGLAPPDARGLEDSDLIYDSPLPQDFTGAEVRKMLEEYGRLQGFDLAVGCKTGHSKGYALCAYQNSRGADRVCASFTYNAAGYQSAGQPLPSALFELVTWEA
ncbi:hypothetical protein RJ639_041926 [Escallonia herrerae]|uniref:RRM domain-containing protein n=1 Tax=Escallonia herrerae TaxID=1293975 RepID=A0AA89B2Y4_9ASTE|nr:hypothetical protein RJ639_041926 [Escallonia herrerae]